MQEQSNLLFTTSSNKNIKETKKYFFAFDTRKHRQKYVHLRLHCQRKHSDRLTNPRSLTISCLTCTSIENEERCCDSLQSASSMLASSSSGSSQRLSESSSPERSTLRRHLLHIWPCLEIKK